MILQKEDSGASSKQIFAHKTYLAPVTVIQH